MAYSVSQDYIDKLYSGVIRRRIRGMLDDVPFTENDILMGSFTYEDKCVSSSDIKLGGVFIGQFKCTFLPSFSSKIKRGTWRGKIVSFSIDLLIDSENDVWESVPCKPYKIDEAQHSKNGVSVTAYDYMYQFDKPFNISTSSGTLYDFAVFACQACNVEFGLTESQMADLPNCNETLGIYPDNDIETWRDLVSWIACSLGGFATIDRSGKLVFRIWHSTPDFVIDINDRFTGGSWSDFETYYTGISIVNIAEESTDYYNVLPDNGLTMNLGSNPLLQYGTKETFAGHLLAILTALQEFVYTPFTSSSLIDPCIDLADVISYTNGLAGVSSKCCVHSFSFTYSKGVKLIGYGKNPALFGARSKTDKNISGLLSRQDENKIVTHTFSNASEIVLRDGEETSILRIRFATINPNVIKILHEICFDLDVADDEDSAEITVHYYLDDDEIAFNPQSSWDNDGMHILPLMYFLDHLEPNKAYSWEVKLEINGGTAVIDRGYINALLEAQGLVATDSWDGILEVSDEYSVLYGSTGYTFDYNDECVVRHDIEVYPKIEINEEYSATYGTTGYGFDYAEDVTITSEYSFNAWGTDANNNVSTHTGDILYFRGHYTEKGE